MFKLPCRQKTLLLSVFLYITSLGALAAQPKVENAIFWEISGKGLKKPSYLFGTYHVLNNSYLDDVPLVKAAFKKADAVTVETELDSSKIMQVMSLAIMPDKKISTLMSEGDYKMVSDEFGKATGFNMAMMDQFKPSFVTVMIVMAYNQKENKALLSKYPGKPIDTYIASNARENGKQVVTFESMQEQMNILFGHDSPEEQAKQLVEFVKSKEEMIRAQSELANMYLKQDLTAMRKMMDKHERQFGDASYLLDDRNVKWMEKLPGILQNGNQFIAVGAMHFVGEKGLIKLLREAGYTVQPAPVK